MDNFDSFELALNDDATSDASSQVSDSVSDSSLTDSSLSSHVEDEETPVYSEPVRSSGKVVLITGGAGFIGSHTAQRLLRRGDKVVVVDEMNDYYDLRQKKRNLEILGEEAEAAGQTASDVRLVVLEVDICDRAVMCAAFMDLKVTHVIHLAARAGVCPSIDDPFIYVQTNVMGTVTLLELAAQHSVANFVYASSSSVYGGSEKECFSEKDIVDMPVSQYAATKKSCELFASTYHSLYGLNCTGLRFFTVYGPRGRPDMAPFKFIHRVMNGITIDQYGDGTSERDYTYIDDVVNGVVLAVDKPLGNQVLNIGRGSPCTLKHFIGTVEDVCDCKADINVMPMQPGDVMRTSADTSKAYELLGYKATMPLERGLAVTCQWYQEWQRDVLCVDSP
jgi:UDP-glucuronate 4-epimerase